MEVRKKTFKKFAVFSIILWETLLFSGFFSGDNIVEFALSGDGKYIINYNYHRLFFFDDEELVDCKDFSHKVYLIEHANSNDRIYIKKGSDNYIEYDFYGNEISKTNKPEISKGEHVRQDSFTRKLRGMKKENDNYILQYKNKFCYERLVLTQKSSNTEYELKDVSDFFFKLKCAFYIPHFLLGIVGCGGVYLVCTTDKRFRDYFE